MILKALGRVGEGGAKGDAPGGLKAAAAGGDDAGREPRRAASREKVEAFSRVLEEREDICWEDLVPEFRANFYDAYDEMVAALFSTDDPFIIYNVVRFADLSQPREVAALARFVRECDAERYQVILYALARTKNPDLLRALQERGDLPAPVRAAINETPGQPAAAGRDAPPPDEGAEAEEATKAGETTKTGETTGT
jgi:hypothetical protein